MKFGVFDHLDASGLPLDVFFEHRLKLVEAYDAIGMHGYHTAEHHATPLGMSASPSVFHAAVAQRTKRLRFGPMVYTLPLYHPLRLAEEVCMLDHLSHGRFQLGIGRGISPIELRYFGVDPKQAQPMYLEAYAVLMQALSSSMLDFAGEHYRFSGVPIMMKPVQQPHPPLWYGIGTVESVAWCVSKAVNVISNTSVAQVRAITDAYRAQWRDAGHALDQLPLMGTARHLVIADTDARALELARRAYRRWLDSFLYLWRRHNLDPILAAYPNEIDGLIAEDRALVGSPATVRAGLQRQADATGVNYFVVRFAFGDLTLEESMRSVELFAHEVMPTFA